jgi:hypothetical protein
MGQSQNFTRNLIPAAAAFRVAEARRSLSRNFSKETEARQLLELYPGGGLTEAELVEEMGRMFAATTLGGATSDTEVLDPGAPATASPPLSV